MQSGVFGSSGAAQARALQQQPPPQPSVPPLNSSQPSLRAQVPQFLSPQVCRDMDTSGLAPCLHLVTFFSPFECCVGVLKSC